MLTKPFYMFTHWCHLVSNIINMDILLVHLNSVFTLLSYTNIVVCLTLIHYTNWWGFVLLSLHTRSVVSRSWMTSTFICCSSRSWWLAQMFGFRCLQIPLQGLLEVNVFNVLGRIYDVSQYLILKSLTYFSIALFSVTPKLHTIPI